jgi:Family of unknown function (DUF5686)
MILRFLFLFIFSFSLFAQKKINGIVLDINSFQPIAFAKIKYNQKILYSDFDGKFEIITTNQDKNIKIEALGFLDFECELDIKKRNVIYLTASREKSQREEENHKNALLIIKKSFENSPKNNPRKTLKSYEYKGYQHLLVSANLDSLKGIIDTIYDAAGKFKKIDSSDYKFKKFIEKQDVFQYEKIAAYYYQNKLHKETILAIKMSGFDEPIYEALGFVLQSLSLYEKNYEILGSEYLNPISKNAPKKYVYKFISIENIQNRKVYKVYFKPKNNKEGLEGLLYIDAETFAIAKTSFKIRDFIELLSIHDFEYFEKEKIWMPKKLEFKITKGNREKSINFLGRTINFESINAINESVKGYGSDFMFVSAQTNFFDHQFNNSPRNRHQRIAIEVQESALEKNSEYWKQFNINSLEERKVKTYQAIDSISKRNKIEKRLDFGRKIIDGYINFGAFDFDIRHFIKYNNFEGLRLGVGGITNRKFSKMFKIGGHYGYGFKDNKSKFKLETALRIGIYSDTWLRGSYEDDVKEIASTFFSSDPRIFTLYDSRPINFTTFYNHKSWVGSLQTNIIPYTNSIGQIATSKINPQYNYSYFDGKNYFQNYQLNIASASFQINPFSDFMQTPSGRIEIYERFPKFTFQLQQTIPNIANDLVFSKMDFRTVYEKNYLNGMQTQLYFQSGFSFGDVPASHLYNSMPNNPIGDNVFERLSFDANYGFETMFQNEFFSSTFVFFQAKHHLKKIKIFTDVEPIFGIVTRAGWGNIHNIYHHFQLDIKAHNKGYYESGVELLNLYFGLGLGCYYRYGPYQFSNFQDNISVKFNFKWDFWL